MPLLENCFFCLPKIHGEAIPKHRPAKNPASQKARQSPTKNRFKFQNNNPKTGRRAKRAAPFLAARFSAPVVVLKFVSIFCRTWLGFLAEPFSAGCWPPDFGSRFLDRLFEDFSKQFPNISQIDFPKNIFSQIGFQNPFFSKSGFSKTDFSQNRFFQTRLAGMKKNAGAFLWFFKSSEPCNRPD